MAALTCCVQTSTCIQERLQASPTEVCAFHTPMIRPRLPLPNLQGSSNPQAMDALRRMQCTDRAASEPGPEARHTRRSISLRGKAHRSAALHSTAWHSAAHQLAMMLTTLGQPVACSRPALRWEGAEWEWHTDQLAAPAGIFCHTGAAAKCLGVRRPAAGSWSQHLGTRSPTTGPSRTSNHLHHHKVCHGVDLQHDKPNLEQVCSRSDCRKQGKQAGWHGHACSTVAAGAARNKPTCLEAATQGSAATQPLEAAALVQQPPASAAPARSRRHQTAPRTRRCPACRLQAEHGGARLQFLIHAGPSEGVASVASAVDANAVKPHTSTAQLQLTSS